MYKNTPMTYGSDAKSFHWLIAMLLIAMFIIAYIMINIPESNLQGFLFDTHKATGLLLFVLVGLRLIWRQISTPPPLPASVPKWQVRAS